MNIQRWCDLPAWFRVPGLPRCFKNPSVGVVRGCFDWYWNQMKCLFWWWSCWWWLKLGWWSVAPPLWVWCRCGGNLKWCKHDLGSEIKSHPSPYSSVPYFLLKSMKKFQQNIFICQLEILGGGRGRSQGVKLIKIIVYIGNMTFDDTDHDSGDIFIFGKSNIFSRGGEGGAVQSCNFFSNAQFFDYMISDDDFTGVFTISRCEIIAQVPNFWAMRTLGTI